MSFIGNSPFQGMVSGGNIQDGTVGTADLVDGSITESKLGTYSVTTDKLADGTVTAIKLAAGAAVPAQAGNAGKFLTTDGTTSSWGTVDTSQGDTAYGWGDHAQVGYLTSYTETDPIYTASSWYTTTNNSTSWDTAYSWGDHSQAGYALSNNLPNFAVSGSLTNTLNDLRVQYGTAYQGTPGQGSFFFDSLNQKLMVHTGAGFVDAVPAGSGGDSDTVTDANTTFRKYTYEIGTSTNAVSGTDAEGETLAYVTDGTENVEVFVNGVKQVEGATRDYVATTGTAVTFTYNLPVGSVVDIQVYEFLSNDAYYVKSEVYTKAETNTQISTGLSSYLPLSGGTLTNLLNITSSGASGASNTETLRLTNNATSFGGDGLAAYNASTGYDSADKACLTYYARGAGGVTNILTEVGNSTTESVTDHRYVATDSGLSLNIPLKYETYFAYNGTNMGVDADQKLTEIRGSGQTGSVSVYGDGRLIASKLGVGLTSPGALVNFYLNDTIGAADGTANMANATLLIGSASNGIGFDDNEIIKTGPGELYVSGESGLDLRGTLGTRSLYVHSDSNVKVGTGTPTNKLHVYQPSTMGNLTAPTIANAVLRVQDESYSLYMDGNAILSTSAASAFFQIGTQNDSDLQLLTGLTQRVTIAGGGSTKVGIDTDTPLHRLHVDDSSAPGPAAVGNTSGIYITNGGSANTYAALQVNTTGGLGISVQNSGNTGFGTATPNSKVDIHGDLTVRAAASTNIHHNLDTAVSGDYVVHRYIGSDGAGDNYIIGYGPTHTTTPGNMAIKANTDNGVIGFYNGATSTERVAIEVSGKLRINNGTVKFQDVTNPAEVGGIVIAMAQGAVANVTPTTGKGGFANIVLFNTSNGVNFNYPQGTFSGIMFYDVGPSPSMLVIGGGSNFIGYNNATFTGAETADQLHVSAKAGYLQISNQYATAILLRFIFT